MTALRGIKVLELGRVLAGPWAGQVLADLGADVIKIEHPIAGDDTRGWGPPFFEHSNGSESRESAYYLSTNRGKRSFAVDFANPEGLALVQRLAAKADIVIENFRVGALNKYGLDYDTVAATNRGVIYCSITGFGQSGPKRFVGGYDFIIQALGGLMSVTGLPDNLPGGEPMKVGVPVTDLFTGMYAAVGILAALNHRRETGAGQSIDISLFDVQVATLANQGMNFLVSGDAPTRMGNDHPNVAPCGTFPTIDGYIVLTIGNHVQFERLCETLGKPELAQDDRFRDNARRSLNRGELNRELVALFKSRTTSEWISLLESARVPIAPVNSIAQAFDDPQAKARQLKVEIDASYGRVPGIASPLRLSATPVKYERAPPTLGEHTWEILRNELTQSDAQIERLLAAEVVCSEAQPKKTEERQRVPKKASRSEVSDY